MGFKISAEKRREIATRLLGMDYDTQQDLAAELDVAESTISLYKGRLQKVFGKDILDNGGAADPESPGGPSMTELALKEAVKVGQQSPNGMFGSGALKRILMDVYDWDAKAANNAMYRAIKRNSDFKQVAAGTWQYVGDPPQDTYTSTDVEVMGLSGGGGDDDEDADEGGSSSLTETPLKPPEKEAYTYAHQAAQNHEFGSPPWSEDLFEGNDVVCYCVGHGKFDDAIAYSRDGMVIAVRKAKPGDVVVARVVDVKPTIAITEAQEWLRDWGADDE